MANNPRKLGTEVVMQTGVTSATTTGDAVILDFEGELKCFYAKVSGSGAVSATVVQQSSHDGGSTWGTRNTMTLNGTNFADEMWSIGNPHMLWRTSVTAISGTGATVETTVSGRK